MPGTSSNSSNAISAPSQQRTPTAKRTKSIADPVQSPLMTRNSTKKLLDCDKEIDNDKQLIVNVDELNGNSGLVEKVLENEVTQVNPSGANPETSDSTVALSADQISSQSSTMPAHIKCFLLSKAKRVRFFRNGDQYFKGIWYAISAERVRSFQALLGDLNRSLTDAIYLPHGVRHIFSLDGLQKINHLDEFVDGDRYVCSSTDMYKKVDYENAREPIWCISLNGTTSSPILMNTPLKQEPNDFVYPRIITIIRNGLKPRRVVRHLLNKRTARSFLQVIQDITLTVKLDSGAVRKVFSISGKEVTCLADFFENDDIFIAFGKERVATDDFLIVNEENKFLYKLHHRHRKMRMQMRYMPAKNESLRKTRVGSIVQDSETSRTLPLFLDDMLHIVRLIGDGNTALVYEVIRRDIQRQAALKVIIRENIIGEEDLVKSEIHILQKISHDYIVQMINCWHFDGSYYLLLELISGGDLFEFLCKARKIDEVTAASLMKCLASALDYLHTLDIVHRDVKPENLLIYSCPYTSNLMLKLADFGLAVVKNVEPLRVICGTPTYVAPEVLAESGYDEKVDMWATGVILYVLLCGFPPFQSVKGNQEQLFSKILSGRYNFPVSAWKNVSYAAKSVIQGLLQLNTFDRFSADDVLKHPWIQGIGIVSEECERLMEDIVKSNMDLEYCSSGLEEGELEYFLSRKASMYELSANDGFYRRNSSFEYF